MHSGREQFQEIINVERDGVTGTQFQLSMEKMKHWVRMENLNFGNNL